MTCPVLGGFADVLQHEVGVGTAWTQSSCPLHPFSSLLLVAWMSHSEKVVWNRAAILHNFRGHSSWKVQNNLLTGVVLWQISMEGRALLFSSIGSLVLWSLFSVLGFSDASRNADDDDDNDHSDKD